MIPYGVHVLTVEANEGAISVTAVNWVTQSSFSHLSVAKAIDAHIAGPIEGRPGTAILGVKDLSDNVLYGG